MNRLTLLMVFAVAGLTGCNSKPADSAPETESVSLFKEGKGVWCSDQTKKLLGVEIVEVAERPMQRHLQKTAQVYRTASTDSPAAAMLLLSADEARELKVDQSTSLKASSEAGPEIIGKLVRLDTEAQAMLGQVEALVEFADPQRHFPIGSFLSATLTNSEPKSAFVVPESAVLAAADGSYVYALNGSHLTRTRVKAGAVSDGWVEIEDGLYAGDSVAAKGVENVWLIELSALKGGTPCCPVPKKEK
jgi:multidrug efflux pump subunit AcrA (membrane-fusion protein)